MKRTAVVALMLALVVTGCGGSKKDTTASQSSPSPTAAATTSSDNTGFSAACLKAARDYARATSSLRSVSTGDLESQFGALADQLRAFGDSVPSGDVRDALSTLADAYDAFAKKVKGVDYNPASGKAPPQAYIDAFQSFSAEKVTKAAATLGNYFSSSCH